MGGTGETVSYQRFYKKFDEDVRNNLKKKRALKKEVNAIIDTVTTAITVITLADAGDDLEEQGSSHQRGSGRRGGQAGPRGRKPRGG